MSRIRRAKMHHSNRANSRKFRTRARTKDVDQIEADLKKRSKDQLKQQPIDEDRPGLGQHYCVECSRYFVDETSLEEHTRSKVHKRRLKQLEEGAYTQQEAEAAVGLTTQNSRSIVSSPLSMEERVDIEMEASL